MIRDTIEHLAVRLGLKNVEIFGEEPPYPNPHGFETTPSGIPIVPQDEVKKGGFMNNKTVFHGAEIVSSGEGFVARTDMGGTVLRKGDMFAFQNADPSRPALVYKVIDTGPKNISLDVEDVGFLAHSADAENTPEELQERAPSLIETA